MKDKILIIQGDITKITVDAIVNTANSSLLGGNAVTNQLKPIVSESASEVIGTSVDSMASEYISDKTQSILKKDKNENKDQ